MTTARERTHANPVDCTPRAASGEAGDRCPCGFTDAGARCGGASCTAGTGGTSCTGTAGPRDRSSSGGPSAGAGRVNLDRAVTHLIRASTRLRALGLRVRSRVVDTALYEVGQAIYGRNVTSPKLARRHIRAALALTRRFPGESSVQTVRAAVQDDLRGALKEL